MKRRIISLFAALLIVVSVDAHSNTIDSLLRVYDDEIERAQVYLDERQAHIDLLQQQPPSARQQLELAELYRPYQSDSAIACLYRVINTYPNYEKEAHVKLLYLFSSIGLFVDGFDLVNHVNSAPDSLRLIYYEAKNRLYTWASNNVKQPIKKKQFVSIGQQYLDSMNQEALLYSNDPIGMNAKIMRYRVQGNYKAALEMNDSIFAIISQDTHDYALYAYQRYLIFKDMELNESAMQWLIQSAIADVRCAVTDNGASWVLANMLYQQGEIERANRYIEYSLSNVAFYNAPIRFMQVNKLAHTITSAHYHWQISLSRKLRIALGMTASVLILLVLVFAYTIHQNLALRRLSRKQKKLNMQLESLSSKQQYYIGYFLTVYSEYIRRLSRKARKAGERDTENFYRQELQKFYDTFDETVLSLYPDFVCQFNALLSDEGKITPPIDGKLTTELRIYACVCMGIDNVTQIAELLFYSPSTIYNYRVRIKNSALGDRDTFEQRVRKIRG
jgi:hypothetical protein